MNSLIDDLLGDTSCTVDGSQTSSNPLSLLASGLIDNTYQQTRTNDVSNQTQPGFFHHQPRQQESGVNESFLYQNSYTMGQFSAMNLGSTSHFQDHTNELESVWSSGHGAAVGGGFAPFAGFPFMSPYSGHMSRSAVSSGAMSNAKSSSLSTVADSTATAAAPPVSVDDVLRATAQAGDLSKEDLARIHRVIGYDATATTETIQENMSDALPSKLGYTRAWEKLSTRLESLEDTRSTVQFTRGELNPYISTEPLLNAPNGLLALSKELFVTGDVKNAILACEAEVQKHPDSSEGWHTLGTYYAENEDDKKALQCLKRAVEIDPFNIAAQLDLGTSYVNELNTVGALTALQSWLKHNPALQDVKTVVDAYSDGTMIDDVTQLMLSAATTNPNNADVHTVLGILYNVSLDYAAAAEHFKKALSLRPNDYALLNKMGATLANNKQSMEATRYYAAALQQRPSYTRGWVNLGIAFFNMGDDVLMKETVAEAAKCFVQALSLAPHLSHVWTYLRMALTNLNMLELVQASSAEDTAAVDTIGRALGVEQILSS